MPHSTVYENAHQMRTIINRLLLSFFHYFWLQLFAAKHTPEEEWEETKKKQQQTQHIIDFDIIISLIVQRVHSCCAYDRPHNIYYNMFYGHGHGLLGTQPYPHPHSHYIAVAVAAANATPRHTHTPQYVHLIISYILIDLCGMSTPVACKICVHSHCGNWIHLGLSYDM